ncbi:MAG: redoxin domain-containing protein [Acidimicrobiales bacterium]|jgi:peroxiredoxin
MSATNAEASTVEGVLSAGTPAPDFTLATAPGEAVTLSEMAGPVVLIFYPADFSPVCGDELSMFQAADQLFAQRGAHLLALSVDNVFSHVAFAQSRNLTFPLLADFNPKGAVARSYGVYREDDGFNERALFVLDADHAVAWSFVSPVEVSPGVDGALAAVEALS